MVQTKISLLKRTIYGISAIALLFVYYPNVASAAQITSRSVTLGSSVASASTTYSFAFTVPSATVLQSAEFMACTTASGTCTMPSGFSVASSTLTGQPTNLGDASGWTVSTATAGSLRLSKSGNAAAPTGSQTVSFSNVVNPSATNSTFFLRMTTYSTAAWTTPVDTGTVAASTAGQITVTASVDETLTFTLAAATVPLGSLTTSATGSGTSSMTASTNATNGYSITVAGTTLTSGANTITALATPTASSTNNKQFGINLMSNTTPAVGTGVSGSGSGVPTAAYSTANLFKFVTGDTVASATAPTNSNTFTTSYIANIDGVTAPGNYSTVLTYVATANF
ncbi:MAG: exported protein of unknown function [Candidatus Saccharibacteria bacterium]|nr:exported protein of unknown function [Candidatus Saccharibacteria bacterium]